MGELSQVISKLKTAPNIAFSSEESKAALLKSLNELFSKRINNAQTPRQVETLVHTYTQIANMATVQKQSSIFSKIFCPEKLEQKKLLLENLKAAKAEIEKKAIEPQTKLLKANYEDLAIHIKNKDSVGIEASIKLIDKNEKKLDELLGLVPSKELNPEQKVDLLKDALKLIPKNKDAQSLLTNLESKLIQAKNEVFHDILATTSKITPSTEHRDDLISKWYKELNSFLKADSPSITNIKTKLDSIGTNFRIPTSPESKQNQIQTLNEVKKTVDKLLKETHNTQDTKKLQDIVSKTALLLKKMQTP